MMLTVTECLGHCIIACGETQAVVSNHITVSVLMIHSIFQYIFLLLFYSRAYPIFTHGDKNINQLREELLSTAEGYLHQALSGTSAVCYFSVSVPLQSLVLKREATLPLMMRKSAYHWEAKW